MPPDSHEVVVKPARVSSAVWKYGVKLKHKISGKWSFKCLGSPACRWNSIFIGISEDAASNATYHIKEKHNAVELMLPSGPQTSVFNEPSRFAFATQPHAISFQNLCILPSPVHTFAFHPCPFGEHTLPAVFVFPRHFINIYLSLIHISEPTRPY